MVSSEAGSTEYRNPITPGCCVSRQLNVTKLQIPPQVLRTLAIWEELILILPS